MQRKYNLRVVTDLELSRKLANNGNPADLKVFLQSLNSSRLKSFAQFLIDGNVYAIEMLDIAYKAKRCVPFSGPYIPLMDLCRCLSFQFNNPDGNVEQDLGYKAHIPFMLYFRLPVDKTNPLYGWEKAYRNRRRNLKYLLGYNGFSVDNLQGFVYYTNCNIRGYVKNSPLLTRPEGNTKAEVLEEILTQFDRLYESHPNLWNHFINDVFFARGTIEDYRLYGKDKKIRP